MIKCDTCGLWHGNSKRNHLTEPPVLAPLSDRNYEHFWSWIYFHGKAEEHVQAYQDHLLLTGAIESWEAPDLVRSNTPIEQVEDGRFQRVLFVDGTEMIAVLWSAGPEYRQDHKTGVFNFHARRRGLICLLDDDEALDYAFNSYDEKKDCL